MIGITDKLIDFALNTKYEDIPGNVIDVQKKTLADTVGVILAAGTLGENIDRAVSFAVEQSYGSQACNIIGFGSKASPVMAAFANGAMIHCLDFEDSQDIAHIHPNTASIPALLALAQITGCSGKDLISAMVIASECACRISASVTVHMADYGWYPGPSHAALGATLGACRLLGLDHDQTRDALAMNMTQLVMPFDIANSKKSDMRTLREGLGARSAVFSALSAKAGIITRADAALEGKNAYFACHARGHYDPDKLLGGLGKTWYASMLTFKPWPCCRGTHSSIECLGRIMKENVFNAEDIEKIELKLSEMQRVVLEPRELKWRPENAANAKFSIPFTLGVLANRGSVKLSDFTEASYKDPDILAVADKVVYELYTPDDPALRMANIAEMTLTLKDGRSFYAKVDKALGDPENPMDEKALEEKFISCASCAREPLSGSDAADLLGRLISIDEADSASAVISLL